MSYSRNIHIHSKKFNQGCSWRIADNTKTQEGRQNKRQRQR